MELDEDGFWFVLKLIRTSLCQSVFENSFLQKIISKYKKLPNLFRSVILKILLLKIKYHRNEMSARFYYLEQNISRNTLGTVIS